MRWLDFSGAPPLLIPRRLVQHWHGAFLPDSNRFSELNTANPRTDYDRACREAWPGRGVLRIADGSALVLYTEFDDHTWDEKRSIVACGHWLPSDEMFTAARWTDALRWEIVDAEFVLMNSAASGRHGLRNDDWMPVTLAPGAYLVEYADIAAEYTGCFHKFTHLAAKSGA
jgi:hypothetical protein